MAHVDLCSGIGGFALGFEWAGLSKPVLFCDIEPWSRKILKKHWPDVPIAEDVKELADDPDRFIPRNHNWSNTILSAGYPCQPFSVAGRQRGTEDPRHIWPWLFKLLALKRPKFCVFENVTGHIALGLDKVLNDLEGENYAVTTLIIPASAVGAPHRRERLWIIAKDMADTQSGGRRRNEDIGETQGSSQSDATQFDSFGGVSSRPDNVGNSQHDGSSATEIERSNQENARRSTQGAIKAEQSQGASGRGHYEAVADTDSTRQQQSYKKMENRPSKQSDSSGIQSRQNVADTNDARNRASEHETEQDRQTPDEGRQEQPQSEFSRQRNNVADTRCEHGSKGNTAHLDKDTAKWSASAVHHQSSGTRQPNNVADTDNEGLQRGVQGGQNTQRQGIDGLTRCSGAIHGQSEEGEQTAQPRMGDLADGLSKGLDRFGRHDGFEVEPSDIPRVASGIKDRANRLKGLGNAIVPGIAMQIGLAIKETQWK